jgi:hypothetical protein
MTSTRAAFDLLFDLLQQINDDEIETALEVIRRYSADVSLLAYPPYLVKLVCQVPVEARGWFETVLCVRAQQVGRKEAWSRFAEQSYREISPWAIK